MDADHQLASFLLDLRPQSLESLEIFSYSSIGAESFLALNHHRDSLFELKLESIHEKAMPAISNLKECTKIITLSLKGAAFLDIEKSHHDVFLETIEWLQECKNLETVSFSRISCAPALMTPILMGNNHNITKMQLGYVRMSHRNLNAFFQALGNQTSLRSLWLDGSWSEIFDGTRFLVESLSKLTNLTDLQLQDISDWFSNDDIMKLAGSLTKLEVLVTSGSGITDVIWDAVASLESLRRLDLMATTTFTAGGILKFVQDLKPGNKGFLLAIMMAEHSSDLTVEEQSLIRDTLAKNVEGKFEFILMRG